MKIPLGNWHDFREEVSLAAQRGGGGSPCDVSQGHNRPPLHIARHLVENKSNIFEIKYILMVIVNKINHILECVEETMDY